MPTVFAWDSASQNAFSVAFSRLLRFPPTISYRRGDQARIRAVGTYYTMFKLLCAAFCTLLPRVANWTERERESCAYFGAVTLNRRIAYTRQLWAEQIADREH